MSALEEQLIRLGEKRPDLQANLRSILDALTKTAAFEMSPELKRRYDQLVEDVSESIQGYNAELSGLRLQIKRERDYSAKDYYEDMKAQVEAHQKEVIALLRDFKVAVEAGRSLPERFVQMIKDETLFSREGGYNLRDVQQNAKKFVQMYGQERVR